MQMWKSTLTVAATLLQLTQASPTPLISRSDCTDGEVYNGFTIYCATDLAGGDLSTTQATTLDGCIDTCVSTTDCVAVSYVAPFCYLKNVAEGTSSSANVIAAMIESTGPCSSDSSASSYTSGDDTFSVTCGWDYSGYDISNEQTTTFEGCMNACAADSQCYAVSYTTGSWCYLKSAGVGGSANADVNAASLPFSSTTTTTTTSTTTATSSTTTTAVATGLCINDQGDGSSFTSGSKTYTISCGFDYYGYDISMVQTSTFEDCVSACSSDSDCTALSWTISGFCYMKNGVSVGDADADVMGAYVPSASSTTTTTTSTTTTGTTSSTTTTTTAPSTTTTTTTSSLTPSTTTSTTSSSTTPSTTTSTTSSTTSSTTTSTTSSTTTSTATPTTTSTTTTTTTVPTTTTTTTTTTTLTTTSTTTANTSASTTTSTTTSTVPTTTTSSTSTTTTSTTTSTTTVVPTTTTTTTIPTTTTTSTSSSTTTTTTTTVPITTTTTTTPSTTTTVPTTTTTLVTSTTTSKATTTSTTSTTTTSTTKTTTTKATTTTTSTSSKSTCATANAQCGGWFWNGATCCSSGYKCQEQNIFYWECVRN
ncbi:hypothetical protein EDD37DRAFT_465654 [Exophiala viscosa]|uniref:uncharacterized protein n=1 Tax=Exophiala viscosa TaxID=2486360 RepID=UPI00219481B1|nr:hypothetical protein EDD37DRAFT_465654 [Exophiala viscosa]